LGIDRLVTDFGHQITIMSNQKTTNNRYADTVRLVLEDRAESADHRVFSGVLRVTKMNLLLDVLLTDRWEFALRKIALATTAARPDIKFTAEHMRAFVFDGWDKNRRRCRHFVRRLHGDEQGLDLLWLMLSACPQQTWTYNGWIDRLTAAFNEMTDHVTQIEEGLLDRAVQRYQHWLDIAGGFPTRCDDPFAAVTEKQWGLAIGAQVQKEIADRAAAAAVAHVNSNPAPPSIRDLVTVVEDDVEAVQELIGQCADGVQVLPPDARGMGLYRALAVTKTPLALTPDLLEVRDALRAEFPHAVSAIDLMLGDLRPGEPVRWRPFLLLGPAGSGKSRMVRRLCELMGKGVRLRRFDGAGSSDNAFGGTPKRWTSATPCAPLQAVAEARIANPVMLIDEVDKAGRGSSGCLTDSLMPFLEAETARAYPDPCFEIEADLSFVNYVMTANDDTKLPSPLRDRLRIVRVPTPGIEHIESLARSIMADLAVEMNVPAAFLTPLAPDELAVVARMWSENGSNCKRSSAAP
jgi:hypothetical protein